MNLFYILGVIAVWVLAGAPSVFSLAIAMVLMYLLVTAINTEDLSNTINPLRYEYMTIGPFFPDATDVANDIEDGDIHFLQDGTQVKVYSWNESADAWDYISEIHPDYVSNISVETQVVESLNK